MTNSRPALLAGLLGLVLAGCGGSQRSAEVRDAAPATAPEAGDSAAVEKQPGGAGDEEPIRQPARFILVDADVQPASIAVAPFLAVALTVVNRDPASHAVRLVGTRAAFTVPSGGRVSRRLPGLKAGMYTLAVDGGKAAASLIVGDEVGP